MDIQSDSKFIERFIENNYGDTVSLGVKMKNLVKFGYNDSLGTSLESISYTGGFETYLTDNLIINISSSSALDTQSIILEGHTIDADGNFTFTVQEVILNGTSKVLLTTPLARATRLYNNDNTDLSGELYVYEDDTITIGVPDTNSKIHLKSIDNGSLKAEATVDKDNYWVINQLVGSVDRQSTSSVNFRLQIREKGKVFRTIFVFSVKNGSVTIPLPQLIFVKPNSDVRMVGISSSNSTPVYASIHGSLLVKVNI